MAIRVIIFDFDGVIVESVDVKTWAFAELFKQEAAHINAIVRYHKVNGGISRMAKIRHIYAEILKKPLSEDVFETLCRRYSELVVERVKFCPFVQGALEFLQDYQKQFIFFVVSGTPQDEMRAITKARNLDGFFKEVHGSPQIKSLWVKKILEQTGKFPSQTLVVGDALADYEAAKANHTHFIARIPRGEEDLFVNVDSAFKLEDLTGLAVKIDLINASKV